MGLKEKIINVKTKEELGIKFIENILENEVISSNNLIENIENIKEIKNLEIKKKNKDFLDFFEWIIVIGILLLIFSIPIIIGFFSSIENGIFIFLFIVLLNFLYQQIEKFMS